MLIANISIDLTKIDKSKINNHQNGAKYYSIDVIINDEKDEYGKDVSVKQGQTKEERERRDKFVYIGSGRVVYKTVPVPTDQIPAKINEQKDSDGLPF